MSRAANRHSFLAVALALASSACGDSVTGPALPPQPEGPLPEGIVQSQIDWLWGNLFPYESEAVRDDRSDLRFLSDLVGGARVVALGEATHGSGNIFTMKHRILDYLVREEGFRHFAIEATMPEMFRIDDWVKGGEGHPAVLLSGQYFWTWRTQAVLDLLLWARAFNEGRSADDMVSVVGFDMQYPGMPVYNVRAFLSSIDPDGLAFAEERLACVEPYVNDAQGGGLAGSEYGALPEAERDACRSAIDEVYDYLLDNESRFTADRSPEDFAYALQNVRLVQQWEDQSSRRPDTSRDRAMAENVLWLMDQAGSDSRWILWAHNGHVYERDVAQGGYLAQALGDDYVSMGFAFREGSFTAVNVGASVYGFGTVTFHVDAAPDDTYEAVFAATGVPRFMLDLRGRSRSDAETAWLFDDRRRTRWVGSSYDPNREAFYLPFISLADWFDVIIYQQASRASVLLPYTPPSSFDG